MYSARDIAAKAVDRFLDPEVKAEKLISFGRVSLGFLKNGACAFILDNKTVHIFHSEAVTSDNIKISTSTAVRKKTASEKSDSEAVIKVVYEEGELSLCQVFRLRKESTYFTVSAAVSRKNKTVKTNYTAPLAFIYPSSECDEMFRSLSLRMLIVPYDNDMWVRYENAPLAPGKTSYDITAFSKGKRGLVIGALDFDKWKNAVRCSAYDARVFTAFSGIADFGTHDSLSHGMLSGDEVSSAEFFCGMYEDIRDGLEQYGDCVKSKNGLCTFSGGVPFGWNSYSALMASLTTAHWRETADFFSEKLPAFCSGDGSQYINLDASFGLSRRKKAQIIKACHERGQKVGTYIAPLMVMPVASFLPLKGSKKRKKDIILKKPDGTDYHTIDGSLPVDITLPQAQTDLRLTLREIVSDGYDYLKIDFLSHGALEGERYDKNVVTGRQALMVFYNILREELSPEKTGREIFISLSIAPLFPSGFGHARRCCCDAFGHIEDSDYVLSSLRHGWWESGRLYQFSDPDHTVLCNSVVDKRGLTSEQEAKMRYCASVISGTVMLLSDNYGPYGDKKIISLSRFRTEKLTENTALIEIARTGKAFRPLYIGEDCNVFYLNENETTCLAAFNFSKKSRLFKINPYEIGCHENRKAKRADTGEVIQYGKEISFTLEGEDCLIYKIT